jgi:hypothetical protein
MARGAAKPGWLARATAFALVATLALPVLAACSRTAGVSEVFTALDGAGLRRRSRFTTDSKGVFCVVEYAVSRPGATLEVFLRQRALPNGTDTNRVFVAVEESPSPSESAQRAAVALTAIDEKTGQPAQDGAPIPPGLFRCEVKLDGELAGFAEFRVDYADCPAALIADGMACQGYFDKDKSCPRYGASSTDKTSCTCTGGAWVCDK